MGHYPRVRGAADEVQTAHKENQQSAAWRVEIRGRWCGQESILGAGEQLERSLCRGISCLGETGKRFVQGDQLWDIRLEAGVLGTQEPLSLAAWESPYGVGFQEDQCRGPM